MADKVVFRIAGQVLDFLKEHKIYAMTYGGAIVTTYAQQKYETEKYDRVQATFVVKPNKAQMPKQRELILQYTPLKPLLYTYDEPVKVEVRYYSKHPSKTAYEGKTDAVPDMDKLLNGMFFNGWDYNSVVGMFKKYGFKTYAFGMRHTDLDLDSIVLSSPNNESGTPCNIRAKLQERDGYVVTDIRVV